MKYDVQLSYPKATKQPVYMEVIEARTKGEALLIAIGRARQEGWRGEPNGQKATIAREQVA
ncbi:hypothetical protein FQZ97_1025090 [compost metagenome]